VESPATARQADALVAEIGRQVEHARGEILAAAAREAEEIRQRARAKARRQLRRAVGEMRAVERQRTAQLKAELATQRSRRISAQSLAVLAQAWPLLGEAIRRRWADPQAQVQWLQAQIGQARVRLRPGPWRIAHPANWGDAEREVLRACLARHGVAEVELHADPDIPIGLVIDAAGARLDSSEAALLADRAAIEAALLATTLHAKSVGGA
jgi:vacuolar-type H+-ATPase subunit E/Vma4